MNETEAHKFSRKNKEDLAKSDKCGCFYCLRIFDPSLIKDWWDKGGSTAICPFCRIDSVVGSASGVPITDEMLRGMQKAWFSPVSEKNA